MYLWLMERQKKKIHIKCSLGYDGSYDGEITSQKLWKQRRYKSTKSTQGGVLEH